MKNKAYAKPFEQWEREDVQNQFGLVRNDNLPALHDWLNTDITLTAHEQAMIDEMHTDLHQYLDLYNEDELKLFFISDVLKLVKFKSPIYRAFTQRQMEFTTQNVHNESITVKGIVELVVAKGQQNPQKPFFFLQEFKQSLKRNNDPLGQLLIAMLCAQILNNDQKNIYGCYVLGESWYCVVLAGKEYGVSLSYNVTKKNEFQQLIAVLKEQKKYIEKELGN